MASNGEVRGELHEGGFRVDDEREITSVNSPILVHIRYVQHQVCVRNPGQDIPCLYSAPNIVSYHSRS